VKALGTPINKLGNHGRWLLPLASPFSGMTIDCDWRLFQWWGHKPKTWINV